MELQQTIKQLNFPNCYQDIIDTIDLEKANDFVKAMVNSIIRKYGFEFVKNEIELDNSNSKISTHLTHIIEVGGLKIISDNKLNINNDRDFGDIIVSVTYLLNCSLAIELKNLKVYDGNTSNYYSEDAMYNIFQRLAKHTYNGMQFSNGLEYYANLMIFNNLINELVD